jgi:hypothetical protein
VKTGFRAYQAYNARVCRIRLGECKTRNFASCPQLPATNYFVHGGRTKIEKAHKRTLTEAASTSPTRGLRWSSVSAVHGVQSRLLANDETHPTRREDVRSDLCLPNKIPPHELLPTDGEHADARSADKRRAHIQQEMTRRRMSKGRVRGFGAIHRTGYQARTIKGRRADDLPTAEEEPF